MPTHELKLKVGMPIMMLHSLAGGQANGAILMMKHISNHLFQATIMNSNQKGEEALIPRIKLISTDETLPHTTYHKFTGPLMHLA